MSLTSISVHGITSFDITPKKWKDPEGNIYYSAAIRLQDEHGETVIDAYGEDYGSVYPVIDPLKDHTGG